MSGDLNLRISLFLLDTREISGEQAATFQQQANQWHNNFQDNQVVVNPATFAVQFAMASDPEFKLITQDQVPEWYKYLTVVQTAQIIAKYFGDKTDIGKTLAENFLKFL